LKAALRATLLAWFEKNRRDLPWRRQPDWYGVWISEVMLQQTQVATALPYFQRWMARFPNVHAVASAREEDVLVQWQGLGYYRRCRSLVAAAKLIAVNGWPTTASEWRKLPGIGRYTAGAICSIVAGEPVPVVDGNVERVFARFTNCGLNGAELHRQAWTWAGQVLDQLNPGDWNQALMELGATICTPSNPKCDACPLASGCEGRRNGTAPGLPNRVQPVETVHLTHAVVVPHHKDAFGLRKIPMGEWWESMWEFPRSKEGETGSLQKLVGTAELRFLGRYNHSVTKHRIRLDVHLAECEQRSSELRWVSASDMAALAIPAPQRRAFEMARSALVQL
jgi:A/G-specific adenine glycosylase